MKTMHESCVGSTGVTEGIHIIYLVLSCILMLKKKSFISLAAITRFSDVEMFDNDEKLKCYMSCVFQEVGVTDDDGFLHMEKLVGAVGLLDDEAEMIFLKMAKRCLRPIISTHCETAFWYNKCWKTTDPVHYFLL